MKLTKCEQCGGPTAEGLPLCPDCMRATGAAVDQIAAAGEAVATAAAGFRQKRKVSVYHVGDVTRVEVENAGRADIPAAVKALNEQAAEVDE